MVNKSEQKVRHVQVEPPLGRHFTIIEHEVDNPDPLYRVAQDRLAQHSIVTEQALFFPLSEGEGELRLVPHRATTSAEFQTAGNTILYWLQEDLRVVDDQTLQHVGYSLRSAMLESDTNPRFEERVLCRTDGRNVTDRRGERVYPEEIDSLIGVVNDHLALTK